MRTIMVMLVAMSSVFAVEMTVRVVETNVPNAKKVISGISIGRANSWSNGKYIISAIDSSNNPIVGTSSDGVGWVFSNPTQLDSCEVTGFVYNGQNFIVYLYRKSLNFASVSPDGVNWTSRQVMCNGSVKNVTFACGKYIGNTYGGIAKSGDGLAWADCDTSFRFDIWSMAWSGKVFMASGVEHWRVENRSGERRIRVASYDSARTWVKIDSVLSIGKVVWVPEKSKFLVLDLAPYWDSEFRGPASQYNNKTNRDFVLPVDSCDHDYSGTKQWCASMHVFYDPAMGGIASAYPVWMNGTLVTTWGSTLYYCKDVSDKNVSAIDLLCCGRGITISVYSINGNTAVGYYGDLALNKPGPIIMIVLDTLKSTSTKLPTPKVLSIKSTYSRYGYSINGRLIRSTSANGVWIRLDGTRSVRSLAR